MMRVIDRDAAIHALRLKGTNLRRWCEENGFGYMNASAVLRGINRCTFGRGRIIAERLRDVIREAGL